jgi:Mrp family chromosome partitioning ATPase
LETTPLPPNPAELLQGTKMRQLISGVRDKFDLVILDGPPILGLADALIIGNAVDRLLLVIQAGITERSVVKTAVKRLRMARVNPVGCLLNKLGQKHLGYGYDYHYSYYAYGTVSNKPFLIKRFFRAGRS